MKYGYKANYSKPVQKILQNPDKSRALAAAIHEIRSDPAKRSAPLDGGRVSTDPRPKSASDSN